MQNAFMARARSVAFTGTITLATGTIIPLEPQDIISFSSSVGVRDGMLPGAVVSRRCSLMLYRTPARFPLGLSFRGAKVQLYARLQQEDFPLCVFYVDGVTQPDGSEFFTLTGSDGLDTRFEGVWQDTLSYPLSLHALVNAVMAKAGLAPAEAFPGADQLIGRPPAWGEISLRGVLMHAAQACGCFCMAAGDGTVGFYPVYQQQEPLEIFPENTFSLNVEDAVFGPLEAVSVTLSGQKGAAPVVVGTAASPSAANCLYIAENPLFTDGATARQWAQQLLNRLQGMTLVRMQLRWQGDARLQLGQPVRVWDTRGSFTDSCVTALSVYGDQGFSMQSDCTYQPLVSATGRLFTPTGGLNAARLQGEVDGALLKAESVAARHLAAYSVTSEKVEAGAITADKIAAGAITADKLAADAIEANVIEAVTAELQRLVAGEITTDELYVALAQIANAQIETADIDFAHVKDLVTDKAIITEGVSGELYIARLAVTEANMVSLSVGELMVKGEDGGFYALTVDDSGNVITEKKLIANDDLQNASIHAGEKLIESSVTAKTLNVQDIFADSALVRQLMAANIDVDTLFAREATIEAINALDIRGNSYLKLTVDGLRNEIDAKTSDATGQQMTLSFDSGNALETEDSGLFCRVHVWKNGQDITDHIPDAAFTWTKDSGQETDAAWNAQNTGKRSVTLTREDIGKSCQISCTVDAAESYGTFEIVNGELLFTGADEFEIVEGSLYGDGERYVLKDGTLYTLRTPGKMTVTSTAFDHTVLQTSHILIKDEKIEIQSGGDISLKAGGKFTVESDLFKVDGEGKMTAKAGEIGGWNIAPGNLQSGEGAEHVRLSTEDDTYGLWAGAEGAENAPFRVARDGTVYLTKLYVTDAEGNAQPNPVNLRTSYYKTDRAVRTLEVKDDTLTITLYDGTTVNFKKPSPSVMGAVQLEGVWSGPTWTVTGKPGDTEATIATTINISMGNWSGDHTMPIFVYASNSPSYLIQRTVDASGVYDAGYQAGWDAAVAAITVTGEITSIVNTAQNYYTATGWAGAKVDGVTVKETTFSKSQKFG